MRMRERLRLRGRRRRFLRVHFTQGFLQKYPTVPVDNLLLRKRRWRLDGDAERRKRGAGVYWLRRQERVRLCVELAVQSPPRLGRA